MTERITLADGSEREIYTPEETAQLVENANKAEKAIELETQLEETKAKLEKLENKDFNFKKLREMTEDEKDKLTATEIELKKKAEELEENQKKFQTSIQESYRNEALAVLAGKDEELKKKVLFNYSRISGEELTKEQINEKVRLAYNMLGTSSPASNPLNSMNFSGHGVDIPMQGEHANKKVDSELARNLGITEEDLKMYDKLPNKSSSVETGKKNGFTN